VRSVLISALVGCSDGSPKSRSLRFLEGLSSDELQFIAEYLGASILESMSAGARSRSELAARVAQFQSARAHTLSADEEHKMILLLEFLCRHSAVRLRPASASEARAS
jgi:hypothetical protein